MQTIRKARMLYVYCDCGLSKYASIDENLFTDYEVLAERFRSVNWLVDLQNKVIKCPRCQREGK